MRILQKIKNRFYYPCMFCGERDNKVFLFNVKHPDIKTGEWHFHMKCLRDRIENSTLYDEKEVTEARNIAAYYILATGTIMNIITGEKDGRQGTEQDI